MFKKKPKASKSSLPSFWKLIKSSLISYGHNWKKLIGVALIVALPYSLAGLASGSASNETVTAYGSFAAITMNLALIWTIQRIDDRRFFSIRSAYYEGTASIVKFILITFVLILELLPFTIGAIFFSNATVGASQVATVPERLLVGLLWLFLAIPSIFLIVRNCFAIFIVQESGQTPTSALTQSWTIVKGNFWPVFGRLIFIVTFLIMVTLLATLAVMLFAPPQLTAYGLASLQLLVSITLLPILYLYLFKLYRSLR